MLKFFFTYGSEGHDYEGGWTEITAPCMDDAVALFRGLHPSDDCLRCAGVYTAKEFYNTRMYKSEAGNFGHRCWESISLRRTRNA